MEQEEREKSHRQQEKEKQMTDKWEGIQQKLSEDLRPQMEMEYQKKPQGIQEKTRSNPVEETWKTLDQSSRNIGKEGYEKSAPPELLICCRCGEVGHKKKDCTEMLFCTNCGRYNHITSKCRQPMKENCTYCKKGGHTKDYCPTKRLERFKQYQIKGFQSNNSEPPRQQLAAGAPRLEDHEVLVLNQHQWKQKEIKREVISRLASYEEFGNQVHQKSVGLQDVNITSASVNSNNKGHYKHY